jgi:2',3'-cyclic-nucleotide 2'-phosphodiesterase/3'-nucleotidase
MHFAPLKSHCEMLFKGAAGKQEIARADGITSAREPRDKGEGTAVYAIDPTY